MMKLRNHVDKLAFTSTENNSYFYERHNEEAPLFL